MDKIGFSIILSHILLVLYACQSRPATENVRELVDSSTNFPYVLRADASYPMPAILREISGITFHPADDNLVYAIQDEDGLLFSYDLAAGKIVSQFAFAGPGDYEDLVTDGDFFYILKSNGDLYSFPFAHKQQRSAVNLFSGLLPKGEYESLAFHAADRKLYVLCKACKIDKKGDGLSGYAIDIDRHGILGSVEKFELDLKQLRKLDKKLRKAIKPSAMTRRPSSDEWYILSSIDKALIITDNRFRPKRIVSFARKDFEQPEGIAFDKHENLWISSEAGSLPKGMIYQFKRLEK